MQKTKEYKSKHIFVTLPNTAEPNHMEGIAGVEQALRSCSVVMTLLNNMFTEWLSAAIKLEWKLARGLAAPTGSKPAESGFVNTAPQCAAVYASSTTADRSMSLSSPIPSLPPLVTWPDAASTRWRFFPTLPRIHICDSSCMVLVM